MLGKIRQKLNDFSEFWLGVLYVSLLCGPFSLELYRALRNINSWQITEWLISFDGGFVRRGLGGELVKLLSQQFNLSPSIIIILISLFAWLILTFLLIRLTKGILPNYFILSSIFLGFPIYSGYLIRKDVIGILLLTFALISLKKIDGVWKYFLINALLIVALLNHEAILFYGIPLLLLTDISRSKSILRHYIILSYLPSFLIAVVVMYNKGNLEMATQIADSWNFFFKENYPEYCCLNEHPASIGAIGWTTMHGLSLSLGLFNDFTNRIIYVPAAWIVNMLVCLQLGSWAMNRYEGRRFVTIFLIQLFFTSPLFLLGWDFGRWIFYISTSSLIWISLFRNNVFSQKHLDILVVRLNLKPQLTQKEVGLIVILFGIPRCDWSIENFILSTPIGNNLYVLYLITKNYLIGVIT